MRAISGAARLESPQRRDAFANARDERVPRSLRPRFFTMGRDLAGGRGFRGAYASRVSARGVRDRGLSARDLTKSAHELRDDAAGEFVSAGRQNRHAGRVCFPESASSLPEDSRRFASEIVKEGETARWMASLRAPCQTLRAAPCRKDGPSAWELMARRSAPSTLRLRLFFTVPSGVAGSSRRIGEGLGRIPKTARAVWQIAEEFGWMAEAVRLFGVESLALDVASPPQARWWCGCRIRRPLRGAKRLTPNAKLSTPNVKVSVMRTCAQDGCARGASLL